MKLEIFKSSYGYYNLRTIDGRPTEEMVNYLKENGYRWSRNNNAWYPATNEAKNKEKNEQLVSNFQKRFFDPATQEQKSFGQELFEREQRKQSYRDTHGLNKNKENNESGMHELEAVIDNSLEYQANETVVKTLAEDIAKKIIEEKTAQLEALIAELRDERRKDQEKISKLEFELANSRDEGLSYALDIQEEQQQLDEEAEWERENTLTEEEEHEIIESSNEEVKEELVEQSAGETVIDGSQMMNKLAAIMDDLAKQEEPEAERDFKKAQEKNESTEVEVSPEELSIAKAVLPTSQYVTTLRYSEGEEGNFFKQKIKDIAEVVKNAPKIYQTNGAEQHPIVLRYFHPTGTETLVTEIGKNGEAYGFQCLNGDYTFAEWGYIDLNEVKSIRMMEIDYHVEKEMTVERWLYKNHPEIYPEYAKFAEQPEVKSPLDVAKETGNDIEAISESLGQQKRYYYNPYSQEYLTIAFEDNDWHTVFYDKDYNVLSDDVGFTVSSPKDISEVIDTVLEMRYHIDNFDPEGMSKSEYEAARAEKENYLSKNWTIWTDEQGFEEILETKRKAEQEKEDKILFLKDALKNDEELKQSALVNNRQDFANAYYDKLSEILIKEYDNDKSDLIRNLLDSNKSKKEIMGEYIDEVYDTFNSEKKSITEEKPYNFFINDAANLDLGIGAEIEPITELSAEKAALKYAELKDKGLSPYIGLNIPGDFIFDDKYGEGAAIFTETNGHPSFYIGDNFVKELKENNQHVHNVLAAYKELYEMTDKYVLEVEKPEFLFTKIEEFESENIEIEAENGEKMTPEQLRQWNEEQKMQHSQDSELDELAEGKQAAIESAVQESPFDRVTRQYSEKYKDFYSTYDQMKEKHLENESRYIGDARIRRSFEQIHDELVKLQIQEVNDIIKESSNLEEAKENAIRYFNFNGNDGLTTNNLYFATRIGSYNQGKFSTSIDKLNEYIETKFNDTHNNDLENIPVDDKEYAENLADWIIQHGMNESTEMENYSVSFEDILENTDTTEEWLNEHIDLVNNALAAHNDNELLEYNPDENEGKEFNLYFCSNSDEMGENTLFKQNKEGRWIRKSEEELQQEKYESVTQGQINNTISDEEILQERILIQNKIDQLKEELNNPDNQKGGMNYDERAEAEALEYVQRLENISDEEVKKQLLWKKENQKRNEETAETVNKDLEEIAQSRAVSQEGELLSYNETHPVITVSNKETGSQTSIQPFGDLANTVKDFARLKTKTEANTVIEKIKTSGFNLASTTSRIIVYDNEKYFDFDYFAGSVGKYDSLNDWDFKTFVDNDLKITKRMKESLQIELEKTTENIEQLTSKKDIKAIREQCREILKKPDSEITESEKSILAQYEGAGGLNEENRTNAGILNEFYTPNNLVEKVWQIVDAYAPEAKTVLEPSAGVGKFANNRPDNVFTMHELDETSARINKILHPDATVIQGAYQKQFFDDGKRLKLIDYQQPKYDVVIGNPPYGKYYDKYKGLGEGKEFDRYEEYFTAKGLEALKDENSVMAFVVPSGFLNTAEDKQKEIIATKGKLIDAYRLPVGTFPTTDVGTDIIVMRNWARDEDIIRQAGGNEAYQQKQLDALKEENLFLLSNNQFFTRNPEKILGEVKTRTNRFGKEEEFIAVHEGLTVQDELNKIDSMLPAVSTDRQLSVDNSDNNNKQGEIIAAFHAGVTPALSEVYPDDPDIVREETIKFSEAIDTMDFHKLGHFMLWTSEKAEPLKIAARKVFEAKTGESFPSFDNIDTYEANHLTELWLAQRTNIAHKDTYNKKYFFASEQDIVEYIAFYGSGTQNGKERINEFFEKNKDDNARKKFLQEEYGWFGMAGGCFDMQCNNSSSGIKTKAYITDPKTKEVRKVEKTVSWKELCDEIKRQRLLDIYLDKPVEKSAQDQQPLTPADTEQVTKTKSVRPKKDKWNITKSKGEVMTAEEFAHLYGRDFDEREFPIWAATDWQGNIDLSKLTTSDIQYMHESGNYVQKNVGEWTHKVLFTTGDIYAKIEEQKELRIKEIARNGENSEMAKNFAKNIELLESSKKASLDIEHIHFGLKSTLAEEFTIPMYDGENMVDVNLQEAFILWAKNETLANTSTWRGGIEYATANITREELGEGINFNDIVDYIDGKPVKAQAVRGWRTYDMSEEEKKAEKSERKKEADLKRQARADVANKLFDRYIHEGLELETIKRLEAEYNRRFNSYIIPDYSKLPLFVDGMSAYKGDSKFKLYDQQIKGISFLCNKGNGLLAYDVGVGKTAAGIVATKNQIQTGRSQRPLILVPNQVYSKWYTDIKQLFPNVQVNDLYNFNKESVGKYVDSENPHKLNIPVNSISLCTYEALKNITFTDESCENELYQDFANLLSADMDGSERENAQDSDKIKGIIGSASHVKDASYYFFEDCGFDHITVDEAHNFKNLWVVPRPKKKGESNEYSGIPSGKPSARALKLYGMTQLVQRHNDDRNVFLLTATPFTNSPTEVYSMLSYIGRERLQRAGITSLRSFFDQFAQTKQEFAVTSKGEIDTKQVMKNWKELPALQNILTEFIDKVDGEEAGIVRPNKFTHVKPLDMSELQQLMRKMDEERMAEIKEGNSAAVIVAMNNMRLSCVAPVLANPYMYEGLELPPLNQLVETSPKLKFVCDAIIDMYKENPEKGQFMYVPLGKESHGIIKDYLVQHGIPKEAVEIINGEVNNTLEKKEKITAKFNNEKDKCKIIIGGRNTAEGIDLNGNSYVMYNCSLGWNPSETIQAEGRIWRQGNLQGHVHIVYPVMNDSIDSVLYQKHDEKRSRVNELWNYKGDSLNVEDINPEDLKLDLIKDPQKKAKLILEEETKETKAELAKIKLKIKDFDDIVERRKQLTLDFGDAKDSVKYYEEQIEDYKSRELEVPEWIKTGLKRAKKSVEKSEYQKETLNNKLYSWNIQTPEDEEAYIRNLNTQKERCEEKIKNITAQLPEILQKLEIERLEQKVMEYPVTKQREILEADILNNLRPMKEVKYEILTERHNKMLEEKLKAGDITQEEHDLYKAAGYEKYEKWLNGEIESLENVIKTESQKEADKVSESALDQHTLTPADNDVIKLNEVKTTIKEAVENIPSQLKDALQQELFDLGELFAEAPNDNLVVKSPENTYSKARMTFAEQVDCVLAGTYDRFNALKVSDTPQILLDVGCKQLPILYTQKHLKDAIHEKSPDNPHWHGLTVEQVKEIPKLLANPAILMDSLNNDGSLVAVLPKRDNDNAPLFATIKPNGFGTYEYELVDSNFMLSVYGKDSFEQYIKNAIIEDKILYWNKEKSQEIQCAELLMVQGLEILDSNKILHQTNSLVNPNVVHSSEQPYFNFGMDDIHLTPDQLTKAELKRDEIVLPILNGKESGMYKAFNDFAKRGVFDVVGTKIELAELPDGRKTITETGFQQLHAAMNIYRDKQFETMRYVFINKDTGKIRDQLAITSCMPNLSPLSMNQANQGETFQKLIARAELTDSMIVAVHNHPSGNITASEDDIKSTHKLDEILRTESGKKLFAGHIILDHNSFNVYDPHQAEVIGDERGWATYLDSNYRYGAKDKMLNNDFAFKDISVHSPYDLPALASMINDTNNWNDNFIPVCFANADQKITGVKLYDQSFFNKEADVIRNEFQFAGIEAGAIWAFPVFTEAYTAKLNGADRMLLDEKLKDLIKSNAFTDAVVPVVDTGISGTSISGTISQICNINPGQPFFTQADMYMRKPEVHSTWQTKVHPSLIEQARMGTLKVIQDNEEQKFQPQPHLRKAVGMGY